MRNSEKGFGALIRSTRRARGLTLLDLSHRAGLSVAYLSDIERGLRGPLSSRHIEKIGKALDLGEEELHLAAGTTRGIYVLSHEGRSAEALAMGEAVLRLWTRFGVAGTALDRVARSITDFIESGVELRSEIWSEAAEQEQGGGGSVGGAE